MVICLPLLLFLTPCASPHCRSQKVICFPLPLLLIACAPLPLLLPEGNSSPTSPHLCPTPLLLWLRESSSNSSPSDRLYRSISMFLRANRPALL
ncbi:hypothetical protein EDB19DRAFT_235686 [Suillus lakei]|nr:hypothetical protein EDB19DRAFT_235686 [Suillus lakei]